MQIQKQAWGYAKVGAVKQGPLVAAPAAMLLSKAGDAGPKGISPYDLRMLAHLKRLDEKAAAMKVRAPCQRSQSASICDSNTGLSAF